jgi:hypothetical protein
MAKSKGQCIIFCGLGKVGTRELREVGKYA